MRNPQLIGIAGPAGSGKTTAAEIMVQELGYQQYAFAEPMKEAMAILGLPEPGCVEDKEKLIPGRGYSWRLAAQTLATDWARKLDPDFWVELAKTKLSGKQRVVIADVRFENEAAMIREAGGVVVHLLGRRRELEKECSGHVSEQGIGFEAGDISIWNDGSQSALGRSLKTLALWRDGLAKGLPPSEVERIFQERDPVGKRALLQICYKVFRKNAPGVNDDER